MRVEGWVLAFLLAQPSALQNYQRASELFSRRDFKGADAAVNEALRLDPGYVPALTLKARLAILAEDLETGERALRAAIASDPKKPSLRFMLGFCLYLRNDFEGALTALSQADPKDPKVTLYTALSEEGLGRVDTAIASYEKVIRVDKADTEARVALGRLLRRQGHLQQAESRIDEALAIAPEARDALYEKGQCLLERGLYTKAAEFGERALATEGPAPKDREIHYLLSIAYLKAGNAKLSAEHRAIFEKLPLSLVR